MKKFNFQACVVEVYRSFIKTTFRSDSSIAYFFPPPSQDFMAGAQEVGFSNDYWKHGVQHELAHALLADAYGLQHSYSVWNEAHGLTGSPEWTEMVSNEEHRVIALQRLSNIQVDDPWGLLQLALGEARFGLANRLSELTIQTLNGA